MERKTLLIVFGILVVSRLSGQFSQEQLHQFTLADGLPSQEVYGIAQDQTGYIWLATDAGIACYDGHSFCHLSTKDGLPNNDVIDIDYIDNRMWVNALGPLAYIDSNRAVQQVSFSNANFQNYLDYTFAKDGDYLWVCRSNVLIRVDKNLDPISVNIPFRANQRMWVIEHQGVPWLIQYSRQEPMVFTNIEGNKANASFTIDLGVPSLLSVYFNSVSKGDLLYFHSAGKIFSLNTKTGTFSLEYDGQETSNQLFIREGELWAVQPAFGIKVFGILPDGRLEHRRSILEAKAPSQVFEDRDGNLWFSTLGNGVYFLPAQAHAIQLIDKAAGLADNAVESITAIEEGLLIGNRLNQVERLSLKNGVQELAWRLDTRTDQKSSPTNRILGIEVIGPECYLLASDLGLILLKNGKSITLHGDAFKNLSVSPSGDLLACTHRSVFRIRKSKLDQLVQMPMEQLNQEFTGRLIERIIQRRAYAALMDHQGDIWVHTIARGLLQIHQQDTVEWQMHDPLFRIHVMDMALLPDSSLALATKGSGLILIKNGDYRTITTAEQLASDFCNVLHLADSALWVGTSNGVSQWIDPAFNDTNPHLICYRKSDGLLSNDINDVSTYQGRAYIATNRGIFAFRPKEILENPAQPSLVLYPPIINDTILEHGKSARFSPDQNNIRFRFAAMDFQGRNNTVFQYRLKGLQDQWAKTTQPEVRYINLDPGNYEFQLRVITDKGAETQLDPAFRFSIRAPFTSTNLFIWLIGVFSLGVILAVFSSYLNRVKNKELEALVYKKTQELEARNKELAAFIQKLSRSNKELKQFAHVTAHDLRTPLRNITGFVQLLKRRAVSKLTKEETEYIDYTVAATRQLEQLINDLQSYSQITHFSQHRAVHSIHKLVYDAISPLGAEISAAGADIQIEEKLPDLIINWENGQLLFYNLISNAVKFRHPDRRPVVKVKARAGQNGVTVCIRDNGLGIEPQYREKIFKIFQRLHTSFEYTGTGIGLAICKKIVEENDGKIWLESTFGLGSTFYFHIPQSTERAPATADPLSTTV